MLKIEVSDEDKEIEELQWVETVDVPEETSQWLDLFVAFWTVFNLVLAHKIMPDLFLLWLRYK